MQTEGNRFYRVKAVAELLDVSQNTVYRAIESGRLRAAKFGAGKGALRVSAAALADYVTACQQQDSIDVPVLSPSQADGLACVVCEQDFLAQPPVRMRPVGRSHTGSQVHACSGHDQDVIALAVSRFGTVA